ncbi:hypothetical protein Pfo_003591 [Paulownia fortunei]|nr:hypothetical protein Pfo_003591 [Paulownia fortunei]
MMRGGLNIQKLADLVQAFSFKLWWRFKEQRSFWSKFMDAKYYGGFHPTDARAMPNDSLVWKRLVRIRDKVEPHLSWQVGMGRISFSKDNWIEDISMSSLQ